MALIMVLTIIIVPVVLPLIIPEVDISAWDIAKSLVILMLIPLVIGGIIKARYVETAKKIVPIFNQASNLSLIVLIVLMLILNWNYIISVIGTGAIASIVVLVGAAVLAGYLLGGKEKENKQVLALGTGQRNLAAAMVIAVQNFENPIVMTMVIVAGVVGVVILFITAGEFGRRNKKFAKVKK
jgi:BASS family bile acid:Na+ symporter